MHSAVLSMLSSSYARRPSGSRVVCSQTSSDLVIIAPGRGQPRRSCCRRQRRGPCVFWEALGRRGVLAVRHHTPVGRLHRLDPPKVVHLFMGRNQVRKPRSSPEPCIQTCCCRTTHKRARDKPCEEPGPQSSCASRAQNAAPRSHPPQRTHAHTWLHRPVSSPSRCPCSSACRRGSDRSRAAPSGAKRRPLLCSMMGLLRTRRKMLLAEVRWMRTCPREAARGGGGRADIILAGERREARSSFTREIRGTRANRRPVWTPRRLRPSRRPYPPYPPPPAPLPPLHPTTPAQARRRPQPSAAARPPGTTPAPAASHARRPGSTRP